MAQYEWIFVVDDLADDTTDAIYGMCDALVSHHGDLTLLTITAEGGTAVEAAKAIVTQLQQERQLIRVQRAYEDLVTKVDVASRCNTTPQAVGQWVRGQRLREFPFPQYFNSAAGGIWLWSDVNDWLRRTDKTADDIEYPHREDYVSINHWIREEYSTFARSMPFQRIAADHRIMGGVPCIRGTRIPVATVVGLVADGMTTEELLLDYPQLTADDVREALQFAAAAVDRATLPQLASA